MKHIYRLALCFVLLAMSIVGVGAQSSTEALNIYAVAWSPDGTMLAYGIGYDHCEYDDVDSFGIYLVDSVTRELIHVFKNNVCPIISLDWSSDSQLLIANYGNQSMTVIWNIATYSYQTALPTTNMPISFVDRMHPDGTKIAHVSGLGTIDFWSPVTGEIFTQLDPYAIGFGQTFDIAWNSDGSQFVTAHNQGVVIWDNETLEKIRHISHPNLGLRAWADWSLTHNWIATTALDENLESQIYIWDAATGEVLRVISGHEATLTDISFAPDGVRLATSNRDGTVQVWDVSTGELLETYTNPNGEVYTVDWSLDGTQLAYGGRGGDEAAPTIVDVGEIVHPLTITSQYPQP
ncbi:MAG: WD40 repeat domain-containing protein [Anaerolineae bacterium]|jgi:WD40 repeat protein|nr:WD40 repeat domain-containing protein [Anaerolineae bacterium]